MLNNDSDAKGYVLGRIFALMEYAEGNKGVGRYNECMTRPDPYFVLAIKKYMKLKGVRKNKIEPILSELMDRLDPPFPKQMTKEEQNEFMLGYNHQKTVLND